VIDDDQPVARVLVAALRPDHDARAIVDGRLALQTLLSDEPFDLAYCDLMMGGLSGMDLYAAVAQQAPDRARKLVFMTGGAFTADAAAFLEARGDAVVYKPFDIAAETLRRLAARS
jgi:two-component system NtrC family sensor kinase